MNPSPDAPGIAADISAEHLRQAVRDRYAVAARQALDETPSECGCADTCCTAATAPATATAQTSGSSEPSTSAETSGTACCAPDPVTSGPCCSKAHQDRHTPPARPSDPITENLYNADETPFDAALAASLGCGNPTALADLAPGEDVLDLGSGGGLDVLLSARRVGPNGTAYGLDMTPEMLELARRHQQQAGITNATFLLGTIEDVPLPGASVDVVISNCVINLSPNKPAVLAEAHRVLRPGGRFAVSDIVLLRPIPPELRTVMALWTGCLTGALLDTEYVDLLGSVGFAQASIEITRGYGRDALETMAEQLDTDQLNTGQLDTDLPPGLTVAEAIAALDGAFASAFIRARKPNEQAE